MKRETTKPTRPAGTSPVTIELREGQSKRSALAAHVVFPALRHAFVTAEWGSTLTSNVCGEERPGFLEYRDEIGAVIDAAVAGDLSIASRVLAAQALSLDGIYTELARLAAINLISHSDAADRFMRLALKAQANSRATLEALARLHQPREQVVRHIYANQAIVADEFHHHQDGGSKNEPDDQCHASGEEAAGRTALPGANQVRPAVPRPRRSRKAKVPHARRD